MYELRPQLGPQVLLISPISVLHTSCFKTLTAFLKGQLRDSLVLSRWPNLPFQSNNRCQRGRRKAAGSRSGPDFLDFFSRLYLCTFSCPTSLLSLKKYSPLTRPLPKRSRSTRGMPDSRPGLHTARTYLLIRSTLKAKSGLQANQNPWLTSLRRTGWDLRSSADWGGGILLGTIPEPKVEETIVIVETTVRGEEREECERKWGMKELTGMLKSWGWASIAPQM